MRYIVDLHGHSGYAGGVGNIELADLARTMRLKGIQAYGVGDCLQPAWSRRLESLLAPAPEAPGLFALAGADADTAGARFVWQTEIIITCAVPSGGRKGTHLVILFPGPAAAGAARRLLAGWDVKLDMGRPFLKCADAADVAEKCFALGRIDPRIEFIPAHVLTPQGIYGSDHPVDRLSDVFGDFAAEIHAVETGLSSDPELLAIIPELDSRALVSHSDAHSAALNRVGREFTCLDVERPSYASLIDAIRGRRVVYTVEFHPSEGRYYLTGHRAGLAGHPANAHCFYSPGQVPADGLCPICRKPLTVGVLDRALELARIQAPPGEKPRRPGATPPRQEGRRLVPLVEALAAALGGGGVSAKKVRTLFDAILRRAGTEAAFWELTPEAMENEYAARLPGQALSGLLAVRRGDFSFQPPGFDGSYGRLVLGKPDDGRAWRVEAFP